MLRERLPDARMRGSGGNAKQQLEIADDVLPIEAVAAAVEWRKCRKEKLRVDGCEAVQQHAGCSRVQNETSRLWIRRNRRSGGWSRRRES